MNYYNKIYVFDDIVPKEKQIEIEKLLLNKGSWTFVKDVTNPDSPNPRPGFYHWLVHEENTVSDLHNEILPIIKTSYQKVGLQGERRILQGRSFLQLPLNIPDRDKLDVPHVDLSNFKHLVVLYYVTDADGETVIYENQYDEKGDIPRFQTLQEKQRVMPKQGRVVCFDGYYWHTAAQPSKGTRCIINYNVV